MLARYHPSTGKLIIVQPLDFMRAGLMRAELTRAELTPESCRAGVRLVSQGASFLGDCLHVQLGWTTQF